jgi:hypothetical protein
LRRVSVRKNAAGSGQFELTIEPVPRRTADAQGAADRTTALVEIDALAIRYMGRLEPGARASWGESWVDRSMMPEAVELTLGSKVRDWKAVRVVAIKG